MKSRPKLRITAILCMGILLYCICGLTTRAQEQVPDTTESGQITELNQIMTATEDIEAKELPDESSQTVHSYQSGDSIFVTGETEDGWYQVRYQDTIGYIPAAQTDEMELDVEALDAEFEAELEEGIMFVEEVERQRAENKRTIIWGTVIGILVIAIFVVGIVSAVKGRDMEE